MQKPVRLAVVINDLGIGGAERLVVNQLHFFNKNIFDITLIILFDTDRKDTLHNLVPKDINTVRLNFKSFRDIRSYLRLMRILKKSNFDVVISHLFFSNAVIRIFKLFFRYKVITVEHNTYVNKSKFQIIMDYILSFVTHKIIAVSPTVADFTSDQEAIPRSKFVVVENGIDVDALKEKAKNLPSREVIREQLGIREKEKIVLNISRLVPQKNHKLLIDAFAIFKGNYPEYKLAIVGGGPLLTELQMYVQEHKLSDAITLFGHREDVERFYTISDLFVLTSKIEGFALVCIEAMLFGVPVVSTRTAGPDSYIRDGKNGYLVEDNAPSVEWGMRKIVEGNISLLRDNAIKTAERYNVSLNTEKYQAVCIEALK